MSENDRLISFRKFCEITCLGKTSVYKRIATGEFRPIRLGRRIAFSEKETYAWVAEQLAKRPPPDTPDN